MMSRDLMKTDLECVSPKTTVVQAATNQGVWGAKCL